MGKQGKRAWLRGTTDIRTHIMEQDLDQSRLDLPVTPFGRLFNGAPQVIHAHRSDVFLMTGYRLTQQVKLCAMCVEVGAHGDHDYRPAVGLERSSQHIFHESVLFGLIATEREQFFELIDHKQGMFRTGNICQTIQIIMESLRSAGKLLDHGLL
jgi:hypothetical protein